MPSTVARRPLPALVSLLALLLLTGLVWWRVLHRSSSADGATKPCPTPTVTATATLPPPPKVTVEVLNSTNRTGIATRARTALVNAGFSSPKPAGNDSPKVHVAGVAQIRYGPAAKAGAQLLSYYLPGATLVPTTSKTTAIVVSLGAKYRSVATPSAVAAALRLHKVALSSGAPSPQPTGSPSGSATC